MRRAAARAWRLLRAAAGTAFLAGLLAGLPWGLARLTGSPLPRTWAGWAQAQRFFASPLTDGAIIRFLADAAWLLWAVFALSLVIELIAATRGQPAPRLPAIAPVQALAAALVGATMMTALHVPRAQTRSARRCTPRLPPPQPSPPRSYRAARRSWTQPPNPLPAPRAATARPRTGRGSTGSKEGDDLWDIAGRFLGDPEDWHEIYQLNEGKPQPDGRALTDPNLIIPGWVLLIPQSAGTHAPAPHPGRPGTRTPGGGRTRSRPPALPDSRAVASALPVSRADRAASPPRARADSWRQQPVPQRAPGPRRGSGCRRVP